MASRDGPFNIDEPLKVLPSIDYLDSYSIRGVSSLRSLFLNKWKMET